MCLTTLQSRWSSPGHQPFSSLLNFRCGSSLALGATRCNDGLLIQCCLRFLVVVAHSSTAQRCTTCIPLTSLTVPPYARLLGSCGQAGTSTSLWRLICSGCG